MRSTSAFRAEYDHWWSSACSVHPEYEWRRRKTSNGGIQIVKQCLCCGHIMANPRKHSPDDIYLAEIDWELNDRYHAARSADLDAIHQKHAAMQYALVTSSQN